MQKKNTIPFLVLAFVLFSATGLFAQQDSLIVHNDQRLFMSGMNLAWMDFANDLGNFNEELFTQRVEDLAAAGGNTIRWWLHTNGRFSPQFTDGVVSGIDPDELINLQRALDIAFERGVLLMLCLWSFDMLQPNAQQENWPRNRALLEDPQKTQAYIDNALIPMVEALKGHPGIACWEIFNEPEGMIHGFGWTPTRVDFIHVQRFVNMTAGAIKRTDPDTKVSNGSWNIRVLTDIGSFFNYYRDDRLINAGGDTLGTLDFYMVHYYPHHFGVSESPFHNHASHWQLDRPLLIGEFPSLGINLGNNSLTTQQAYAFAIENGYAGALSWTMTGHDGNGGLPESTEAMLYLQENYPDIINVNFDPNFNYPPYIKEQMPPVFLPKQGELQVVPIEDMNNIFGSHVEGMPLVFSIAGNNNPGLVSASISPNDSLIIEVTPDITGFCQITVMATDTVGKFNIARLSVSVFDPQSEDKLLFRYAYSSTIENTGHLAAFAVDGNPATRWSSEYSDPQWLAVEMEEVKTIQRIMMHWEVAYGKEYEIQASVDGNNWQTVYYEPLGNGGWDKILFEPVEARFIKMYGIERATQWGYSLYSFSAFETPGDNTPPEFTGSFNDTIAFINQQYSPVIPLNMVVDPDLGERLFFDVSFADHQGLPHWLSFDWVTRQLSGTPTADDAGEVYSMKIIVTDMSGDSDEYFFDLYVMDASNISTINGTTPDMLLYPNPARDQLLVSWQGMAEEEVLIRIISLSGQVVHYWFADGSEVKEHLLDVSALKTGSYVVEVRGKRAIKHERFVKK